MDGATTRSRRSLFLALAGCLAATWLAFSNSLSSGFAYDDEINIANRYLDSWRNVPRFFSEPFRAGLNDPAGRNYRPLVLLSLTLDKHLYGADARGYHATNLLLHSAAMAAIFFLCLTLTGSWRGAMVGALLFALHPLNGEIVNGISYRGDLLCAGFGALFLLGLLRALPAAAGEPMRTRPRSFAALAGACVAAFALACLSKEAAVTLIAPLLYWIWITRRRASRFRALVLGGAVLVVLGGYLGLRHHALGRQLKDDVGLLENPLAHVAPSARMSGAVALLGYQARHLIWPVKLSADYSYRALPAGVSVLSLDFLVGAAVAAAVMLGLFASWRSRPPAALGMIVAGSSYFLTSNFFFPVDVIMADRFMSFPLLGCALVAAALAASFGSSKQALAAMLLGAAVFGTLTYLRNPVWRDTESLMRAAVRAYPSNAKAHRGLALKVWQAGRVEEARQAYQRALEIFPDYPEALGGQALVMSRLGRHQEAVRLAERAVAARPADAIAWNCLGVALAEAGSRAEAVRAFRQALSIDPGLDFARARLEKLGAAPPSTRESSR